MKAQGTYIYCVVAADRRPALRKPLKGLAGTGPVRLLDLGKGLWAVVADAPLDVYGEAAINRGLADLDWVSRAAVAHEAVVERFLSAAALLPMKLFTIFTSDDRVLTNLRERRRQIDAALKRVRHHDEWGLRVVLDRGRALSPEPAVAPRRAAATGARYLSRKKAQHDASAELATRAREVVNDLYDRVQQIATHARRRVASELPVKGGPLLIDAAVLVPRRRTARLHRFVAREARRLAAEGYRVTLTGPWPPYSFMQE